MVKHGRVLKAIDQGNDGAYGKLSDVLAAQPNTIGTEVAVAKGLAYHLKRLSKLTAELSNRELLLLEHEVHELLQGVRRSVFAQVANDWPTPTLNDWAEVFGDDAAIFYGAELASHPDTTLLLTDAMIQSLNQRSWRREHEQALRQLISGRRRMIVSAKFNKANRILASLMPQCRDDNRHRIRYLYTEIGKTTRDPKKASRRAIGSRAKCSADSNGWDDVVKSTEENREDIH